VNRKKLIYLILAVFILTIAGCTENDIAKIQKPPAVIKQTPDGNKYYLYAEVPYLGRDREEKVDIYIPYEKPQSLSGYPAVLNIHGGGWHEGHKARKITKTCAEALVEKSYAVFCPDYLLATKEKKVWPQNIYDCKSALRYIRKVAPIHKIDTENIAALGNSAGGHLAMLAAFSADNEQLNAGGFYKQYSSKVNCVVNIYGIADVRKFGGSNFIDGPREENPKAYELASPITHLSKDAPPVLTIHGDKDSLVPITLSEDLDKLLKSNNIEHEFVIVSGGEHAFTLYPDSLNSNIDLRPFVINFLDKHLRN
jgi:acetyl esterase/lipase